MAAFKVEKGLDELARDFPQHRVSTENVKKRLATNANVLFESSLVLCVRRSVQQVVETLEKYYAVLPMPCLPRSALTKITYAQFLKRRAMR